MQTRLLVPLLLLLVPTPARAAIVVIGNYTAAEIAFTVAEADAKPDAKPRAHKLAANHVAPVFITGPANLTFRANDRDTTVRLEMYNAYMFLPDPEKKGGVLFEGVELPGEALERDGRVELNPIPR